VALGLITLTGARNGTVATEAGATAQLSGKVVDEQGRPVAGASVDCYRYQAGSGYPTVGEPELERRTATDSEGAFAVPSSRGATLIVVRKAGLATGWKTRNSLARGSSEPLVLTAPTTLAGVVVDANHGPIAGAEVWVLAANFGDEHSRALHANDLSGKPARECFSARTAADGRFRIADFPADGHAALVVRTPGRAPRPIGGLYAGWRGYEAGAANLELMLGPPGAIEGKVVAGEAGQPIAGARVRFRPNVGELYAYATIESEASGADGTFRVPEVEPGWYRLSGMSGAPGQNDADWMAVLKGSTVLRVAGGEVTRDVVVDAARGAWMEVTVVAGDDLKPLADVEVSPGSLAGASGAYTGTNGVALLRLPPGRAWLSAAKKGWAPRGATPNIEAGQTNYLRIELTRPRTISGTIRDPGGAPVAGVLVSFHPGQYPMALPYVEGRSDANGRYELALVQELREGSSWVGPITRTNFIMARSMGRNLAAIQEFDAVPTELDLTLEPGITLSGSVKDTHGAPVTSAMVELRIRSANSAPRVDPQPARVDAQGCFSFPALPHGRQYSVAASTARGYGMASGELEAEDAKPGHYEFPALVLKEAGLRLAGQVLGPDGKPVGEAEVTFSGQGQRSMPQTQTDSRGRFVFDEVCEGSVSLWAHGYGPPETRPGVLTFMTSGSGAGAQAQAGDTNVIIQVRPLNPDATTGPYIPTSGKVFDPSGGPAPVVRVGVWQAKGAAALPAISNGKGEYIIYRQLPPADSGAPNVRSVLVGRDVVNNLAATCDLGDTVTNIDLHLKPGVTVTGSVLEGADTPVTNAFVSLYMTLKSASKELEKTRTDAAGSFIFKALPQGGEYYVDVMAIGHKVVTHVAAQPDNAQPSELKVPPIKLPATLQLAGKVVGPDGEPVPNLWVQVGFRRSKTDAEGRFVIEYVPPGKLMVFAVKREPSGGTILLGHLEAEAGDTNVVLQLELRKGGRAPR
jgi:protocatechuate 3,4-dioxygenase beta subunit